MTTEMWVAFVLFPLACVALIAIGLWIHWYHEAEAAKAQIKQYRAFWQEAKTDAAEWQAVAEELAAAVERRSTHV